MVETSSEIAKPVRLRRFRRASEPPAFRLTDDDVDLATRDLADVRLIHPDEIVAAFPEKQRSARNPLALRVKLSHEGITRDRARSRSCLRARIPRPLPSLFYGRDRSRHHAGRAQQLLSDEL